MYISIAGCYIRVNFYPSSSPIQVNNLKGQIERVLAGFIVPRQKTKPLFVINVHKRPITTYMKNGHVLVHLYHRFQNSVITYQHISIGQFIYILVNEVVLRLTNQKNGFILHCSSAIINDHVHLFLGMPNAGKSTMISLLRPAYEAFSDDSIFIKRRADTFWCYQTPYIENNAWIKKTHKGYKLGKIFFLRKGIVFSAKRKRGGIPLITRMSRQLWSQKEYVASQLPQLLALISRHHEVYDLTFAKNSEKTISFLSQQIILPPAQ